MVLGVGYWALTDRLIPAQGVGVAAAAVSATIFLSALGVLGIGSLLLVALHGAEADERPAIIGVGLLVAMVSAFVLSMGAWALSPYLGRSLSQLGQHPVEAALFVCGAVLTTMASVLDSAAIGLRRSRVQLVRNTVASALRVALVFVAIVLGVRTATGLLSAWVVSLAVSVVLSVGVFGLLRTPRSLFHLVNRPDLVRRFRGLAMQHHILNLSITLVAFFLPVLAALLLVPRVYAYFSTAWIVSSTVLLIPALLAMTLFAEATNDVSQLRRHIRRTLPIGSAYCALLLAVFEPGAPLALSVFGAAYSQHGSETLRILVLAGAPYVVKDHWVAIRRAQGRLTEAAGTVAFSTIFEAVCATVGAVMYGLVGLSAFWVAATVAEALFFGPELVRVWRGRPSGVSTTQSFRGDCPPTGGHLARSVPVGDTLV